MGRGIRNTRRESTIHLGGGDRLGLLIKVGHDFVFSCLRHLTKMDMKHPCIEALNIFQSRSKVIIQQRVKLKMHVLWCARSTWPSERCQLFLPVTLPQSASLVTTLSSTAAARAGWSLSTTRAFGACWTSPPAG